MTGRPDHPWRGLETHHVRRIRRAGALVLGLLTAAAVLVPGHLATASAPSRAQSLPNPASLVHPLDGTGTGPVSPGTVGEFPGADVPFGMLQWSPDTTPDTVQSGGGYDVRDSAINGFSLTHLSGTGCPSYQDVPILPTVGPLDGTPVSATDTFSHAGEEASPGRYQVTLGPDPVTVALAVTTRTGIAGFDFPPSHASNVLFKVSDSANPATVSRVSVVGRDEVEGQVTSGGFCGTGTNYTLHFVARFTGPSLRPDPGWTRRRTGRPIMRRCRVGAFVTFDTTTQRQVRMKVGISFVSTAEAAHNLAAEDPGWSFDRIAGQAQARWNVLLGRIAVGGGTPAERHTFYTASITRCSSPTWCPTPTGRMPAATERSTWRTGKPSTPTSRSGTSTAARSSSRPSSTPGPRATWCSPSSTMPHRAAGSPSGPSWAGTSRR